MESLHSAHPDWPPGVLDLVLLAQAISQIREADIAMESMVQLVWVMLGDRLLLTHEGINYVYSELGHWEVYSGILPEYVFLFVAKKCLAAEGLFRAMGPGRPREVGIIAEEAQRMFAECGNDGAVMLAHLEEVASSAAALVPDLPDTCFACPCCHPRPSGRR